MTPRRYGSRSRAVEERVDPLDTLGGILTDAALEMSPLVNMYRGLLYEDEYPITPFATPRDRALTLLEEPEYQRYMDNVASSGMGATTKAGRAAKALPAPRTKAEAMAKQVLEMPAAARAGFDDYLKRVNPRGVRVAAEERPNLMMGDMYGMLPSGAKRVGKQGDVSFYRGPDGDFYATAFNPDFGEQDVVGYIMPRGDMTELAVVSEMQGKGIGGELQYLFRKENPNAPTGGLTEAGEKVLRKTYERLSGEGLLSNPLRAPRTKAEAVAKDVLELRAAGKAEKVTDEMMAAADPQYLFENTPLPMDEASRMARAKEMGFDTDAPLYHGTEADFFAFNPSVRGKIGPGVYLTPEQDLAEVFSGDRGIMLPVLATNNPAPESVRSVASQARMDSGMGESGARAFAENLQGYDGLSVADQRTILDPRNIRSRFARFDPEFRHLANLSAGVGGLGILSLLEPEPEVP